MYEFTVCEQGDYVVTMRSATEKRDLNEKSSG